MKKTKYAKLIVDKVGEMEAFFAATSYAACGRTLLRSFPGYAGHGYEN